MQSFVDCYVGYYKILMDEEDVEKDNLHYALGCISFQSEVIRSQKCWCYVLRVMTVIFHDMIHKEIEVYVYDVIIKFCQSLDHLTHLRKFFDHLCRYNLKLNTTKCIFGVLAGKLLGFIVSRRGIELDPSKIKAI